MGDARRRTALGLACAVLVAAGGAQARFASPDPFAIPIRGGKPALGAGYDGAAATLRSEPGACVSDLGTEREDASSVRYALATLSRAGGRLVIGVYVAAVTGTETLSQPRLTDASRRLASSDAAGFRALCGDGFVARVELGRDWIGELEFAGADAQRAGARLVTGTWTDPAPFRTALEAITRDLAASARELPDGRRAAARELAPAALVERALGFAAGVTAENEKPFLALWAPYAKEAFSGLVLPGPGDLDPRDLAEPALRGGEPSLHASAASRAAEMRKAVVQRDTPEEEAAVLETSDAPEPAPRRVPDLRETIVLEAPPAAPAPAASAESAAVVESPASRQQAALVFERPNAPSVFATTSAPPGLYAEHVRQRYYWVPGAAEATPEVQQAIEAARNGSPSRGTTIAVVASAQAVVVLTDAAPVAGIYSQPAGERRAWIAGVAKPDAAERAAIDAAVAAEAAGARGRE